MQYLSILDIFGVEIKQQIRLNEKKQKSKIGGIVSILIIGASLAYMVYVFKQWINFELLPKSSNNRVIEEISNFVYDDSVNFFEFLYRNVTNNKIDPFSPTNNILIPLGLYFENDTLVQTVSFLNQSSEISSYGTLKYGLNKINLSQNSLADSAQLNVRELMLVFIRCNETFLSEGQSCASEDEFQQFFKQTSNYLLFKINLQDFDPITQQNKIVTKSYYITLDLEIATQGRLFIQQTHAYVDTGMLLESITKRSFVQEAQILTFSTRTNFLEYIIQEKCYLNIIIRLDPVSSELFIVYPKLGEILADVGSIINLLLLIRYLIFYYNKQILEGYFTDQILSFYFKNICDLKQQQKDKDKSLIKALTNEAKSKLVYINIIYELSKIQLFLSAQFGRDKLIQSNKFGIKLPNVDQDQKNELDDAANDSDERGQIPENEEKFTVEDFFVFSQQHSLLSKNVQNSNFDS